VVVFDFDTWEEVTTLKGGGDCVLTLALSADGKTLVSSGHGGAIRVWDTVKLAAKKQEFTPMPGACVQHFDLSPNGQELVAIHAHCGNSALAPERQSEALRVWDWKTERQLDGWGTGHLYQHARFLPDGRVVQSTFTGSIAIWTGRGEKATAEYLTGHGEGSLLFDLTGDGKRLLAHGGDGKARWWDLTAPTAEPLVFDTGLKGGAVTLGPAGRLAAVTHDGTVRILKLPAR
jgi:WD40 repeat protein